MIIFGITFSAAELWFLGACGALIIVWVRHLLALNLRRKNIIEEHVNEFIAAFSEAIHSLRIKRPFKIKDAIKQHKLAALDLRRSLNWWEIRKFNTYWNQYQEKADSYDDALVRLNDKTKIEMLDAVEKLIKKVKRI